MAFGQDFLQGFAGNNSLRDYQHASKTFLSNGYELTPRNKFLFHVFFNVNTNVPSLSKVLKEDLSRIGLMVKTVDLPKYNLAVDTMNQYNRKRLIQTKIDYQPCRFTLHDDQGDLIRNLWYNYFSYYYKDPTYQYDSAASPVTDGTLGSLQLSSLGQSYNVGDIYNPAGYRTANDWGYIGDSYTDTYPNGLNNASPQTAKQPFFKDIRIYGMSQHTFAAYILINPLVTSWSHDTYNYSEGGGIMEHNMEIKYEAVKYYSGAIGKPSSTFAQGFGSPAYYDTEPSPLARPGSTLSVLGQGGLIDAGIGIYDDLQKGSVSGVLGAVQKATTTYQTWKKANAKAVINNEVKNGVQGVLRDVTRNPTARQIFPTPPR